MSEEKMPEVQNVRSVQAGNFYLQLTTVLRRIHTTPCTCVFYPTVDFPKFGTTMYHEWVLSSLVVNKLIERGVNFERGALDSLLDEFQLAHNWTRIRRDSTFHEVKVTLENLDMQLKRQSGMEDRGTI
ncbi:Hypothetical protein CINCED_3A023441 [Cinara cedri]|uniref:Uncharacterized protein n=1 Tax=Cinara cedri TaxID=506608 RepID=A0A5E4MMJ0_9HEMI|nr:Hypothetical protein CINCED_3A023441 [Cinara cedri]